MYSVISGKSIEQEKAPPAVRRANNFPDNLCIVNIIMNIINEICVILLKTGKRYARNRVAGCAPNGNAPHPPPTAYADSP